MKDELAEKEMCKGGLVARKEEKNLLKCHPLIRSLTFSSTFTTIYSGLRASSRATSNYNSRVRNRREVENERNESEFISIPQQS